MTTREAAVRALRKAEHGRGPGQSVADWLDANPDAKAALAAWLCDPVLDYIDHIQAARDESNRARAAASPSGDRPQSEPDPEYMCPNCVTPWKCNGPHIPRPEPMCSPGCGSLRWTVEKWGRVTHKHACVNRTDPFCQTHPDGCLIPLVVQSEPSEPTYDELREQQAEDNAIDAWVDRNAPEDFR